MKEKVIVNSGYYIRLGEQGVYFEFGVWWLRPLESVADKICTLSGHRLESKLMTPVMTYTHKKVTRFDMPMTPEQLREFCLAANWEYPEYHDDGT